MIPPDVASRLRLVLPDQPAPPQPVAPAQQLTDVLSDLAPGQRMTAQIQALLPNGTYRAVVAQRDITLSLPFSAKPGDSLELEVVERNGRMTFAVVADRGPADTAPRDSVATTLSRTGQLISDLLEGIGGDKGGRAQPAALNGNQPLVGKFPEDPAQLVPILKDALGKSGMFYESHQARWAAGDFPREALLAEPQGRLSAPPPPPAGAASQAPAATDVSAQGAPAGPSAADAEAGAAKPAGTSQHAVDAAPRQPGALTISAELTPLVQQQLDALATQNFVWQGQIWPGQEMQWEIEDRQQSRPERGDGDDLRWSTRLRLTLPHLGTLEATLRLHGEGAVELTLSPDSGASRTRFVQAGPQLSQRFADAGLRLTGFTVADDGPQAG